MTLRGTSAGMRRTETFRLLLAWAPALLTMGAIWLLSSSPAPGVPIHLLPFRDRGAHFLAYSTLAFFLAHAALAMATLGVTRRSGGLRIWLFAVYAAALWGLLDEVHQAFVPGRSPDIVDLMADTLGASVGGLARVVLSRLMRARATPPLTAPAESTP